jgi:hypothetical protein
MFEGMIKSVKDLKSLEGVFFKKEKGEALRRLSTPQSEKEASALGYFEVLSNVTGNAVKAVEVYLNILAAGHNGDPDILKDYTLSHLIDNIFRSSGSRKAERMKLVAETIQEAKPEVTMNRDFSDPEAIDAKALMGQK